MKRLVVKDQNGEIKCIRNIQNELAHIVIEPDIPMVIASGESITITLEDIEEEKPDYNKALRINIAKRMTKWFYERLAEDIKAYNEYKKNKEGD